MSSFEVPVSKVLTSAVSEKGCPVRAPVTGYAVQ